MVKYPLRECEQFGSRLNGARVDSVMPGSPADHAGFYAGCILLEIDGHPIRDILDWRWLSADEEIELSFCDPEGDTGTVLLERAPGEDWGFAFDQVLFDDVRLCRNSCTFCFMKQLPDGLRPSLSLKDDDFRLSFLSGTFVTLTNVGPDDEQRIIEQRLSPLRVSLQAADPQVRKRIMGRHAAHGMEVLERLLQAGIQIHAQIVLVPDQNDGKVLTDTLAWAYSHPGIVDIGIVPLGYTRFQRDFDHSYDEPDRAREVLAEIEPFRLRALSERGCFWVYAADEFYCNAFGEAVLAHLPPASAYGDFSLYEDGIGIARSCIDEWEEACRSGFAARTASLLGGRGIHAHLVSGLAKKPYFDALLAHPCAQERLSALYVQNTFFGGNVDVTGLLCGCDIAAAIRAARKTGISDNDLFFVEDIVFNDDGLTLDGMRLEDIAQAAGTQVHMVSCSPMQYLEEIAREAVGQE